MPLLRRPALPVRPARPAALVAAAAVAAVVAPVALAAPSSGATRTAGAVTAAAYRYTPADSRMRSALTSRATTKSFGTAFSGAVVDVASDTVLWTKNGGSRMRPASTTKLVTATNALTTFGPAYRFTTRVRVSADGTTLWLVGSGDPGLGGAGLAGPARDAAAAAPPRGAAGRRGRADDPPV